MDKNEDTNWSVRTMVAEGQNRTRSGGDSACSWSHYNCPREHLRRIQSRAMMHFQEATRLFIDWQEALSLLPALFLGEVPERDCVSPSDSSSYLASMYPKSLGSVFGEPMCSIRCGICVHWVKALFSNYGSICISFTFLNSDPHHWGPAGDLTNYQQWSWDGRKVNVPRTCMMRLKRWTLREPMQRLDQKRPVILGISHSPRLNSTAGTVFCHYWPGQKSKIQKIKWFWTVSISY